MGASSVKKFCRDHGISRGTYYNMQKRGEAPRRMKIGSRTLITDEAAADWRHEMEKVSAANWQAPGEGAAAGAATAGTCSWPPTG